MRQHEEQPEELDERRGAAEHLDVGDGEPADGPRAVHPGERREDGHDDGEHAAAERDLDRDQRALQEPRQELAKAGEARQASRP